MLERIVDASASWRRKSALWGAVLVLAVGGLVVFRAQLRLRRMGLLTGGHLAAVATDPGSKPSERVAALGSLRRVDSKAAARVAADLLRIEDPDARLAAATISANAGNPDAEGVLIAMLRDESEKPGYRGMAARRLGTLHSALAHPVIVSFANQQTDRVNRGLAHPEDLGFQLGLVEALGRYRAKEDLPVALNLFQATGFRASARSIGMFGQSDSLPWLREALEHQPTAGMLIRAQLAIARSGGPDGQQFVRELLRHGATLGTLQGTIDLRTEDPLSGRLAEDALRDLGAHPSDRQFFDDVLAMQHSGPCAFCETAWNTLARLGTAGREAQIVEVAAGLDHMGRCDRAIRALAYNGAAESAHELGARCGLGNAKGYIRLHEAGRDRDWFPLSEDWD